MRKAEERAEKRREARRTHERFIKDPFRRAKEILDGNKEGSLEIEQEKLEAHLRQTYSLREGTERGAAVTKLVCPAEPRVSFDCSEIKWHKM